jgi:selenocysteine lyase/cysteine desulfurase
MPIDVDAIGCDFLATTGRKFLRGPRGTGLLYVSRDRVNDLEPLAVEVGGADWTAADGYTLKPGARRFETWEVSYALQLGLGRAVEYALDVGIEAIWERVQALGRELRDALASIDGVSVRDLGLTRCGIVTFDVDGVPSGELRRGLGERAINVHVSTVEDTRLDFEARNLPPLIRASVHYFNTSDEIARLCEAVDGLPRSLKATGARR